MTRTRERDVSGPAWAPPGAPWCAESRRCKPGPGWPGRRGPAPGGHTADRGVLAAPLPLSAPVCQGDVQISGGLQALAAACPVQAVLPGILLARDPAQARGRPPRGAAAQAPWKAGASSLAWVSGQLGSHSVCTREPEGRRARASACSCHTRAVSPRVGRLRRPCGVALPGAGLGTRPLWPACSGRGCLRLRAPEELGPEWETRPCGSGLGARVRRAPGLD